MDIKEKLKKYVHKIKNFLLPKIVRFLKSFIKMMRKERWLFSFVITVFICVFCMIFVDKPFALYFKENLSAHTEGFYKTITNIGLMGWWFGFAIILWLVFVSLAGVSVSTEDFEKNMQKARSFLFMISSLTASAFTVTGFKIFIGRYRPRYLFNDDLYGFSPFNFNFGMNSFPSGHAISIFTAMTALKIIFPRYDAAYMVIAVLVAFSRAFTTVHYVSDVIMGAYLGIAITYCVKAIFEEDGAKVVIKCARDKKLS
ncbi:MAG: phosphatase PAP2 family protein [Alphaproteobacteria bacterium]